MSGQVRLSNNRTEIWCTEVTIFFSENHQWQWHFPIFNETSKNTYLKKVLTWEVRFRNLFLPMGRGFWGKLLLFDSICSQTLSTLFSSLAFFLKLTFQKNEKSLALDRKSEMLNLKCKSPLTLKKTIAHADACTHVHAKLAYQYAKPEQSRTLNLYEKKPLFNFYGSYRFCLTELSLFELKTVSNIYTKSKSHCCLVFCTRTRTPSTQRGREEKEGTRILQKYKPKSALFFFIGVEAA